MARSQVGERSGSGGAKPKTRLFAPRLARRLYPHADALIAVSRGVADDVYAVTGYPRARIHALQSPILTEELRRRAEAPLERHAAPPAFVVGSLSEVAAIVNAAG